MLLLLPGIILSSTPPTRDCMFVHGSGQTHTGSATPTDIYSYWGGDPNAMIDNTVNCRSHWFIHEETVTRAFDDEGLIATVCAFLNGTFNSALPPSGDDGVIRNRTIFSHSMGNLVVAEAFRSGKCRLDPAGSSVWYSASAPWKGSKAANKVASVCASGNVALKWLAKDLSYCKVRFNFFVII